MIVHRDMLEFPVDELCQFGQEFQQRKETVEVGEDDEVVEHAVVDACEPQVIVFVEGVDEFADHTVVFHQRVAPSHLAGAASLTNGQDIGHESQPDMVFHQRLYDGFQVGRQFVGLISFFTIRCVPP